jgi:hypothetical protein
MLLRVAKERLIFEEIEGEYVVIHQDLGTYFNFRAAAATAWKALTAHDVVDVGAAEGAAAAFFAFLVKEGLAVEVAPGAAGAESLRGADTRGELLYERFNDLEEFLKVDPVHETAG